MTPGPCTRRLRPTAARCSGRPCGRLAAALRSSADTEPRRPGLLRPVVGTALRLRPNRLVQLRPQRLQPVRLRLPGLRPWGYDRWGYDRWGYDHWGYNWAGYNWAGYDRNGWDRDGRNEWGQRRDHPGDPRDQDWYNRHHPYEQYYQWKFQNNDPVYHRTQWDQAHGFNPNLYQNWNMNRDWHNPRNRDWAPLATARHHKSVTNVNLHASSPVVNLNASLAQFISNDKTTSNSGPLMKDLAHKSARDFTQELTPRTTISIGSPPPSRLGSDPPRPQPTTKHPLHHRH